MRSWAELTPAASASAPLLIVSIAGVGELVQDPQVDRKPGDCRVGNPLARAGVEMAEDCARPTARSVP